MRKKILVDIYLAYNLGDDMFLDHLAHQFPNYDFIPFHPGKNYKGFFEKYENIKQFPYTNLDKIKARFGKNKLFDYDWMSKNFDGLLFLGGGIFREESYWKEVYQYRMAILKAFKKENKKVNYAGCSFGPFYSEEFFEAYKKLFLEVDQITFRDQSSFNLFSDLPSAAYAPDILWSYPLAKINKEDNHLGISLIDPSHKNGLEYTYNNYIQSHLSIIKKYHLKGFKISLFSFCEAEGDTKVAKEILAAFPNCKIYVYEGNIKDYLIEIGKCSHFIAARFHANIISIKYNQFLIPIIYGDKTENLLYDLNYSRKKIFLNTIQDLENINFNKFDAEIINEMKRKSSLHFNIDYN